MGRISCGSSPHGEKEPRCLQLPLQAGSIEGELEIPRSEIMQHQDDSVPTEIVRERHRGPPVPGYSAGIFEQEVRVLHDEIANDAWIVTVDRIRHLAGEHEPRPAREAVTSS